MKDVFSISLNQLTKSFAERFANKIAVTDVNRNIHYTYRDLYLSILKISTFLSKYLEFKEDLIYINSNSIEHIFLFFACLTNGYRFVPVNPKLKENEVILMLKQIKPKVLIYSEVFQGNLKIIQKELNIQYLFSVEELRKSIESQRNLIIPQNNPSLDEDVLILFTSGTTGIPKPARIPVRMILYNVFHTVMYWQLNSNDSTTIHTPMFHAGGLNVFTTPLLFIGGRLYLLEQFVPEKIFELINNKSINLFFAVPTMFKMMIDSKEWERVDLKDMKLIISGGAPCPDFIFNEFLKKKVILKQGFGMTEVGVNCFFISDVDAKNKVGCVGKPMLFLEVNLVDENNNLIESEGTGTMWFKGPVVFNGYEGYPTEQTFNNLLGFCSGDIAYRDNEGFYWIKGRVKDIIIRGGENIYPIEIEKEIHNLTWINECSLIGMPDELWGEIPVLCVSLQAKLDESLIDSLFKHLKNKFASYKLPHKIIVFDELPKNSTGKIIKNELLKKISNNEFIKIFQYK